MKMAESFIDEKKIFSVLEEKQEPSEDEIDTVIEKALGLKGLTQEETAVLLNCCDERLVAKMLAAAEKVKKGIYGNRIVLFAPLYLTNYCINNCLYCGFRVANAALERRALSLAEVEEEVRILEGEGHKRLLLVFGEHPGWGIDYITAVIRQVYETRDGKGGEIRRVNINCAPLSVEEFHALKECGIGTYQCFQETYHRETYDSVHKSGPKKDFLWRLHAMHRAQEAGIDDVGIGVLFGLFDYRFEVLALLQHAQELERAWGVGPHTISVPRIEPALNAPYANNPPAPVSDEDFKKVVAVIRLAVPYTGMILTTREKPPLRDELFHYGISQISAGSATSPGGYLRKKRQETEAQQFAIGDLRSTRDVVRDLMRAGFFPSFCTACYRAGRTGEDFMALAKPGEIQKFCLPNCLLTLKEYLLDYGDNETRALGEKIISEDTQEIKDETIRRAFLLKIEGLERGERDMRF